MFLCCFSGLRHEVAVLQDVARTQRGQLQRLAQQQSDSAGVRKKNLFVSLFLSSRCLQSRSVVASPSTSKLSVSTSVDRTSSEEPSSSNQAVPSESASASVPEGHFSVKARWFSSFSSSSSSHLIEKVTVLGEREDLAGKWEQDERERVERMVKF